MKQDSLPMFGVYIHWPYCLSKCAYCDFASCVRDRTTDDDLMRGYIRDIKASPNEKIVTSLYFGGGTPSLMNLEFFEKMMSVLRDRFKFAPDVEITIEANPDAIDADKMQGFRSMGVNRISIGVQSLSDVDLQKLGRRHTVARALDVLALARDVFPRVTMDLIYARPGQTAKDWKDELSCALALGLDHYALYQLGIEDGTPLAHQGVQDASDALARRMYKITDDLMCAAGIPAYEVSNYARAGQESRHNMTYWLGEDYVGIGPAAHGRLGNVATTNASDVLTWLSCGGDQIILTDEQRQIERLMMGLRLRQEGFPITGLDPQALHTLKQRKWIVQRQNRIYPTQEGILMLNQLIILLIAK